MKDCNGEHKSVVLDRFSQLSCVSRHVPGDCYCMDCKQPIPAYWNSGRPYPAEGFDKPNEENGNK